MQQDAEKSCKNTDKKRQDTCLFCVSVVVTGVSVPLPCSVPVCDCFARETGLQVTFSLVVECLNGTPLRQYSLCEIRNSLKTFKGKKKKTSLFLTVA